MNRLHAAFCALTAMAFLTGGNCSRARVESMNKMNEGVQYAQEQRYHDATEALQEATALDQTNEQAFFNLAIVYMEQGEWTLAKEQLQRAISLDETAAGFQEKLGVVNMELEDWSGAQEAFERAIEIDADLFKAYYRLGQIHERLDQPQEALQRYTEAVQHGPRFIEAYESLGRLYFDLEFLDQAVQVLRAGASVALPDTEEQASLLSLLGTVIQRQRNFDGAVVEFRKALEIVPGMPDALFGLGWTYYLMDDQEEAKRYLERFIDVAGPETREDYKMAARTVLSTLETP